MTPTQPTFVQNVASAAVPAERLKTIHVDHHDCPTSSHTSGFAPGFGRARHARIAALAPMATEPNRTGTASEVGENT
jgi:hypothetical protein